MSKLMVGVLIAVAGMVASAVGASPVIRSARPNAASVGLYEKFELTLDLEATYDNPFDPDQVDPWAEFTSPAGKVQKIWGFYNPSQKANSWMVRFTPTEKGTWQYVAKVKDKNGTAQGQPGHFTAVESSRHGFVRIAPNQRYLMYSDGTPFYGVGLWYNDSFERGRGAITEANLDELKRRGGNFISFFHTPLETMQTGLGKYDEARCARLDQIFEWCEQRDICISWNIWFHSFISQAVWGGGNARYRENPYHLVSDAKGFFGSAEAWKYEEKLHRYMIARWGYSRALFLWFIIDEINGTEGWEQGDKAVAEEWCRKMDAFFNEHDPYGRPTTGTQSGGIGQWWPGGYKIFDIAAREIYEAQGHPMPKTGKVDPSDESPLRYSYRNYATQTQNLWKGFHKPALVGECGWDHTYYEPGMPGYLAMYHNAVWVSLANGLCCTPFWWAWSDYINDSVLTNQMRYFRQFVADIDFAHLDWQPVPVEAGNSDDGWAMKSDKLIFGWVVNAKTSVAKDTFTLAGLKDGSYEVRLYRPWRGRYLDPQTVECRDGKLTVTIPELTTTSGRAAHIGNDIAFKIAPVR
jgi:hypothetical protein